MSLIDFLHRRFPAAQTGPCAELSSIASHSRRVSKNSLFVALPGRRTDGRRFVKEAVQNGAAALLMEKPAIIPSGFKGPVWTAEDARAALSLALNRLYDFPSRKLFAVAVTGTNGKTGVAFMLENLFRGQGWKPGLVSTVCQRCGDKTWSAPLTSPEPVRLFQRLRDFLKAGANSLVMEASSIGLRQKRLDGIDFNIAIFTNLSHDHLDYHKNKEEYFQSKKRLFVDLLSPGKSVSLINQNDPFGRRLIKELRESANKGRKGPAGGVSGGVRGGGRGGSGGAALSFGGRAAGRGGAVLSFGEKRADGGGAVLRGPDKTAKGVFESARAGGGGAAGGPGEVCGGAALSFGADPQAGDRPGEVRGGGLKIASGAEPARLKTAAPAEEEPDFSFQIKESNLSQTLFTFYARRSGQKRDIALPLPGAYNASNATAALAAALTAGFSLDKCGKILEENFRGAPGRMERVTANHAPFQVFVDYAHTPAALQTVLGALRAAASLGDGERTHKTKPSLPEEAADRSPESVSSAVPQAAPQTVSEAAPLAVSARDKEGISGKAFLGRFGLKNQETRRLENPPYQGGRRLSEKPDLLNQNQSNQTGLKHGSRDRKTRLVTVFGCGGERDREKRPLMMKAALRFSDRVILTSDNPRREPKEQIIKDCLDGIPSPPVAAVRTNRPSGNRRVADPADLAGFFEATEADSRLNESAAGDRPPPVATVRTNHPAGNRRVATKPGKGENQSPEAASVSVIWDRREAIQEAIAAARPGDIVLIAGKGHEKVQITGEERRPFSDIETAREFLASHSQSSV